MSFLRKRKQLLINPPEENYEPMNFLKLNFFNKCIIILHTIFSRTLSDQQEQQIILQRNASSSDLSSHPHARINYILYTQSLGDDHLTQNSPYRDLSGAACVCTRNNHLLTEKNCSLSLYILPPPSILLA